MKGQYQIPPHLGLLSRKLVDVAHGRISRLMVTMPPRHGKSLLTSQYFPAWYIGVNPDQRVILASYEADFAATWSRAALLAVSEGITKGIFTQCELNRKVMSANRWETIAGGGMYAGGIGSAFTGRGANLLLIDDPVKNHQEALSPTLRQHAWDWYQSTMTTRLEPGGAVVLTMTRWNEDDLGGRLLSTAFNDPAEIDTWEIINLPALAHEDDLLGRAPGEPLWPERFSLEELERKRAGMTAFWWSALYDQEPKPREGGMFEKTWFDVVKKSPPRSRLRRCRFWDLAATKKTVGKDPAFTAGVLEGIDDETGIVYVIDVEREQDTPAEIMKLVKATATRDGRETAIRMEMEGGSAGIGVIDQYVRELIGCDFEGVRPTGSKEVRATPFGTYAEQGKVKLVRGGWNHAFLEELAGFPTGKYKDQTDAASGAFGELASAVPWWQDSDYVATLAGDDESV